MDDVDEKIEHCLQLAEDSFNISTYREESSNQWDLNSTELEQDQLSSNISKNWMTQYLKMTKPSGHTTLTYSWKD